MCTSDDCKMSRIHLENRRLDYEEEIGSTPLRRGILRLPQVRLLHKDLPQFLERAKNEVVDNESIRSAKTITVIFPNRSGSAFRSALPFDRFVPVRNNFSVEASNYSLKKDWEQNNQTYSLDVFKQLEQLSVKWQQCQMQRKLETENVVRKAGRVLSIIRDRRNGVRETLPGSWIGRPKDLRDERYHEDGIWPVRPRRQPIIAKTMHSELLQLPGLQSHPRKQRVDWSGQNLLTVTINNSVQIYNMNCEMMYYSTLVSEVNVNSLKWNNSGTRLALTHMGDSALSVHDGRTEKQLWINRCTCMAIGLSCEINCISWSQDDRTIVTGCTEWITVYSSDSGSRVKQIKTHTGQIVSLSYSPQYRSIVTTSEDNTVLVYDARTIKPFLHISYYEKVKAVDWHPSRDNLLCIGGGKNDGSLSIWNVNTFEPLGYRKVPFFGSVEHLLWNKHTAELVVDWAYYDDNRKLRTVLPVLSCLDRIVDDLKIDKRFRVDSILWSPDHTQLAAQVKDCIIMWNFFGGNSFYKRRSKREGDKKFFDESSNDLNRYNIR